MRARTPGLVGRTRAGGCSRGKVQGIEEGFLEEGLPNRALEMWGTGPQE